MVVAFQEIVELNAQQIMSTEPTRRQEWEKAVKRTLNAHAQKTGAEEYVLLRGGQLVGASLSIFVHRGFLSKIKNVEGSLKKTGMSGIAGNKGAVAIRLEVSNTSLCFVTAHLAAGFANYDERNRDYKTISHGLRFTRGRAIDDHDAVIWLGDFNYRIGLDNETARRLVKKNDWERLYENDQLNINMVAGRAFPYYSEARILFPPTYKYDPGTDDYDSSEKFRIPAWCDRILRKGIGLRQIAYDTAPLRFSDHRPVWATFICTVSAVDQMKQTALARELYETRKATIGHGYGSAAHSTAGSDFDDEDLLSDTLPPASSDKRKWWLDNGMPARSMVQAPVGHIPNPERPSNPFRLTAEGDWIKVGQTQVVGGIGNGNMNGNADRTGISLQPATQLPPSLPHRSATAASTSSTAPRKPPPIPRKPPSISSPSSTSVNTNAPQKMQAIVAQSVPPPPLPRRSNTASSTASSTKTASSHTASRQPAMSQGPSGEKMPPVVPARQTTVGLMDQDDGVLVWEALKPEEVDSGR